MREYIAKNMLNKHIPSLATDVEASADTAARGNEAFFDDITPVIHILLIKYDFISKHP